MEIRGREVTRKRPSKFFCNFDYAYYIGDGHRANSKTRWKTLECILCNENLLKNNNINFFLNFIPFIAKADSLIDKLLVV
jgi:hypothetical protein